MSRPDCLEQYFNESLAVISHIQVDPLVKAIRLGNHHARLITYAQDLQEVFFSSLSHLEVPDMEEADMQIYFLADEHHELEFPALGWSDMEFDAQGFAKGLDQEKIAVFFQPWLRQIFLYSHELKIGIFRTSTVAEVPWWEPTFSFRILFHFWSRYLPYQLMHAGAMAINSEEAVLFPAPSGSGKSTTTCYLQEAGYPYLGDDYVLVDVESREVFKLYGCAKMEWDNLLERFPHLYGQCINQHQYPEQKGVFYPQSSSRVHGHRIAAVVVPDLKQAAQGFKAISPARSLLAIAPTTLHHLPHYRQRSYEKISRLVKASKNYCWHLPSDPIQLVEQFNQFTHEQAIECNYSEPQPTTLAH